MLFQDCVLPISLKALRNGIFAVFADNVNCISAWGFYFYDEKFDEEFELRNRLGVIWLASLIDSLEGEVRVLDKYEEAAIELNQPTLASLCGKAREFVETVKEVLSLYSREEQLFIRDLRDQYVHSWLARRHRESFSVKFYDGSQIVTETVDRDSYYAALRPLFENANGLDAVLKPLIERATKGELRYWNAVRLLKTQMPLLERAIMEGLDVEIK